MTSQPIISTQCEVIDTNAPWRQPRIWREKKEFIYAHCVDITDPNSVSLPGQIPTVVNLQVQFADNDTELAYKEHIDTLIMELPDYCQNRQQVLHKCVEIKGKPKLFFQVNMSLKYALSIFPFSLLTLPVFYLMLTSGLLSKISNNLTIRKEITSNNNLQIFL